MHERPTDNDRRKAAREVHSPSKAGHFEGMGFNGKRGGGIPALWDSSDDFVSLEEAIGAGGRGISQGNPGQTEPTSQRVAERESKSQGHGDPTVEELMLLKKKMNLV